MLAEVTGWTRSYYAIFHNRKGIQFGGGKEKQKGIKVN